MFLVQLPSLKIAYKSFKNRGIWCLKKHFLFTSLALSHLIPVFILCLYSWAWYKTKYLTWYTSAVGALYEKHILWSVFLKNNKVLITGITSPLGFNNEDLSKQRLWGILQDLRCRKVGICQSPWEFIFYLRLCSCRTSATGSWAQFFLNGTCNESA